MTFGRIVVDTEVERWIGTFANRWFTEYLAATERAMGLDPGYFPVLADTVYTADFTSFPEEQLPCLLIMNQGLAEEPSKISKRWDAIYSIAVAIIVATPTKQDTRIAAAAYGAAFRTMVLQKPSFERPNDIQGTYWVDSKPAPLAPTDERTLGAALMNFNVHVKGVTDSFGSPPAVDPRPDPYEEPPTGPTVLTTHPQVEAVEEITP